MPARTSSVSIQAHFSRGFTLIELLVVMSIVAVLLTLAVPRYFSGVEHSREVALRHNLNTLRDAIDKHHADTGVYPESLEALVEKRYLKSVPVDPVTESAQTWQIVPPQPPLKGKVFDIYSGASGTSRDGSEYRRW